MKKLSVVCIVLALAACGGGSSTSVTASLTTPTAINNYLNGKTMVMTGADIPAYPLGYNANQNLGTATQCYNKTSISIVSGTWNVSTTLGTLTGASTVGAVGTCETNVANGSPLSFSSNTVSITNVQGAATCFDIDVTYTGFGQEGRGEISADGKTVTLELYFSGQAAHDRCADGAVGSAGVMVTPPGGAATAVTAGSADQVYVIQ